MPSRQSPHTPRWGLITSMPSAFLEREPRPATFQFCQLEADNTDRAAGAKDRDGPGPVAYSDASRGRWTRRTRGAMAVAALALLAVAERVRLNCDRDRSTSSIRSGSTRMRFNSVQRVFQGIRRPFAAHFGW